MKSIWIAALIALVANAITLNSEPSFAADLGSSRVLRKLSQRIRGVDPSEADFQTLNRLSTATPPTSQERWDAFYKDRALAYLKEPRFTDLMHYRLQELFRVSAEYGSSDVFAQSAERLIRDAISQDLSWDTLVQATRYRVNTTDAAEADFFGNFLGSTPSGSTDYPVSFAAGDARVAGVLSTSLFRTRYYKGASNHNRRVAQAFYRILLCDDLQIQVPGGNQSASDEAKLDWLRDFFKGTPSYSLFQMLPPRRSRVHGGIFGAADPGDPHSTQPVCISCHEKLDPAGAAFGAPGAYRLDPMPSAGSFVIRREGVKIEVPVAGLAALAEAATKTPEYSACQARHFWDWFVGEDLPLSSSRMSEIARLFNADRRPAEFIVKLISQPEFKWDRTVHTPPRPLTFDDVKPAFAKCNHCHSSHGIAMDVRPWGGTETDDASWFSRIRAHLEAPDGSSAKMPPYKGPWTDQELSDLNRYVEQSVTVSVRKEGSHAAD